MTGNTIPFDIQELYLQNFGTRPKVGALSPVKADGQSFVLPTAQQASAYAPDGSLLQTTVNGIEIWLPTKFRGLDPTKFENGIMDLPYTVISMDVQEDWITTPMADRRGSAKELYSLGDYMITLKGFFIDRQRVWPYDDLVSLKEVREAGKAFQLDNALSNVYLHQDDQVILKSFNLPPVEGGRKHVRPFVMQLQSDSIFTLELA